MNQDRRDLSAKYTVHKAMHERQWLALFGTEFEHRWQEDEEYGHIASRLFGSVNLWARKSGTDDRHHRLLYQNISMRTLFHPFHYIVRRDLGFQSCAKCTRHVVLSSIPHFWIWCQWSRCITPAPLKRWHSCSSITYTCSIMTLAIKICALRTAQQSVRSDLSRKY